MATQVNSKDRPKGIFVVDLTGADLTAQQLEIIDKAIQSAVQKAIAGIDDLEGVAISMGPGPIMGLRAI